MKVQNPHDKFFKKTFGDLAVAKDFLNNYLPPKIKAIIDIDTLEPQKDSHIDEKLRESFSDLLFKAHINDREGYLYFLFEHKSSPSRDVAFQLLKYMVRIWDTKIEKTGRLPVIIPLLVYHGEKGWNIKPTLGEMISGYDELPPDIKPLIPNYKYLLFDLPKFTDEEIKGAIITRIAVMILRGMQGKEIGAFLETVAKAVSFLQELENKETGLEYFEILLRYIFSARSDLTKGEFIELVKKIETSYPEGREKVMTLADLLRQEGREEGREEGRKEGRKKSIESVVEKSIIKGLTTEDIAEITGLNREQIEEIRKRMLV